MSRITLAIVNILFLAIVILLLCIPNGIRYDATTNWFPKYSWEFLIMVYVYFIIGGVIPSVYMFIKIMKTLPATEVKKKVSIFFIGELLFYLMAFGLVLYNTWDNQIFKMFWVFSGCVLLPAVALLVYYGLGKELRE